MEFRSCTAHSGVQIQTFIMVSHDMDFVLDICDHLARMKYGGVISSETIAESLCRILNGEKSDRGQQKHFSALVKGDPVTL